MKIWSQILSVWGVTKYLGIILTFPPCSQISAWSLDRTLLSKYAFLSPGTVLLLVCLPILIYSHPSAFPTTSAATAKEVVEDSRLTRWPSGRWIIFIWKVSWIGQRWRLGKGAPHATSPPPPEFGPEEWFIVCPCWERGPIEWDKYWCCISFFDESSLSNVEIGRFVVKRFSSLRTDSCVFYWLLSIGSMK